MTPALGERMLCSIFIASTVQTSWPASTVSPGTTVTAMTRPGMGETMSFSDVLDVDDLTWGGPCLGALGGVGRWVVLRVPPVSPSTST